MKGLLFTLTFICDNQPATSTSATPNATLWNDMLLENLKRKKNKVAKQSKTERDETFAEHEMSYSDI